MRPIWIAAILVVVLGVITAFLFMNVQQPSQTTTITTATTTPQPQSNVVSITLYLNDYGYNASRGGPIISAFVGDLVRITLVGNGTGPTRHDFVLDEKSPSPYNVGSNRLRNGERQILEFIAQFEGEYKYYCSVSPPVGPSHRDRGQEGTIVILPKS